MLIQAILEKTVIAIVIFHLTLQEFQSVPTHTIEFATAHIRQCHNDIKLFIRYLVLIKRYISIIFEKKHSHTLFIKLDFPTFG